MNRLWFPPSPLAALLVMIASVSFAWAFSSKAIAQSSDVVESPEISLGTTLYPSVASSNESQQLLPSSSPLTFNDHWSADGLMDSPYRFVAYPASPYLLHTQNLLHSQGLEVESDVITGTKDIDGNVDPDTQYFHHELWQRFDPSTVHSSPLANGAIESNVDAQGTDGRQYQQIPLDGKYGLSEQRSLDLGDVAASDTVAIEAPFQKQHSQQTLGSELDSQDASENSGITLVRPDPSQVDSELGILRLRPLSSLDAEMPSSAAVLDPELGVLRLRALTPEVSAEPVPQESVVFLQGYLSFFNGNNLLARTDSLPDTTLQAGVRVRAVPRLGPRTFLVGTAESSVLKYADHGEFDYNDLGLSVGLYHWLTPRTYVELNWRNQQLFAENGGDRFLNDHQLRLSVGRSDYLTPDLTLNSAYQLQSSWAEPRERSRLANRVTVGLSHPVSSQLEVSLAYQLALIDFTQYDRYDSYHQLLAQFQFALSDEATLTVFGGGRVGESTHSLIDFDSTLLGLSLVMNFSLF